MTTLSEARESVYQRFLDNFTGVSSTRITFDNEEFEAGTSSSWVRLVVRTSTRVQSTLGRATNRRYRTMASVMIQVFVPANSGVAAADSLASEAASIFEGVSFDGLDFDQAAIINEIGVDGYWFMTLVESNFSYDEIK
jgi:Bacteriophage related domain of unknown function